MYQINIDGVNHYAEYLNYVKKKPETGCYIQSNEEDAEAVVVDNMVCGLPRRKDESSKPVAYINEIDVGEVLRKLSEENKNLENELILTQLALTEIYEKG